MVTKAALGTSGLPMTANMRRFPVPWMFFLFEEKAAREEWWPVFAGSPLHSHWPASLECMRFLHALPAQAQRHSSMSQGHRPEEGPAHSQKRAWKMGWSWLYCSRVCLRNDCLLPLHTPPSLFLEVMGNCSSSLRSPLLALSATWWQTPGAPAGSHPALRIHSSRG